MSLQFDSLEKCIDSLERSVTIAGRVDDSDEDLQETVRSGVIQNFEVAYEQSWKMMKRWLEENIGSALVDGINKRELFRRAAENHLITDAERWMDYNEARNLTSHTYDEEAAQSVFAEATEFVQDIKYLLSALKERND